MTCIAWDGKTLAADKLACFGATRHTVTKIYRHGRELLGVTGNLSVGLEMLEWYRNGAEPNLFPSSNKDPDKGCSMVLIKSDGTAWKYESGPYAFRLEGLFCAFGSGDESALIAMECGKSAREAVEIASKYNINCGNGVDTLVLD